MTTQIKAEPQARAATAGDLHDYKTGSLIRAATAAETAESIAAAERDGGRGVIDVDGRACYVEGGAL